MNKVFLSGRISSAVQFRAEGGEAAHLVFMLSVRHKTRAGEVRWEAYRVNAWHDVALWGAKNLARGQKIGVCGYLTQRQVNAGGISALATEVVAEEILPMHMAAESSPSIMQEEVRLSASSPLAQTAEANSAPSCAANAEEAKENTSPSQQP